MVWEQVTATGADAPVEERGWKYACCSTLDLWMDVASFGRSFTVRCEDMCTVGSVV